jgi:hypothetical protein
MLAAIITVGVILLLLIFVVDRLWSKRSAKKRAEYLNSIETVAIRYELLKLQRRDSNFRG